jgi:imidazolonepropionase-like amidohydrolase
MPRHRPLRLAALVALAAPALQAAPAGSVSRYTVLIQGQPSGAQVTTVKSDGRMDVDFDFKTNGRGPTLSEHYNFAADGTLIHFEVSGSSEFGAPVHEEFTRTASGAQWQSDADRGSSTQAGPAVYVPADSSLEPLAALVRAALQQPRQRIAALPAGEVHVERVSQAQLEGPHGVQRVALYAVTGIEAHPDYIWLTDDAAARFFAAIFPGFAQVLPVGFENRAAQLEALEEEAEHAYQHQLYLRLAHHYGEGLLLRNVRVFDAEHARLGTPGDVYVWRGRIAAIYPLGSVPRAGTAVIDGAGRVLLPALFDMHVHEDAWDMLLQLGGGVTSVRDMGNNNEMLLELMHQVDAGEIAGPRVFPCGFIEGESPFAARNGFVVKDLQGAKDAVDWYAQHGYRQIKLYNSFQPQWVSETAAYAHARGLRVSGHVPAFMTSAEAIRAGYDEIQHINQLMLLFFVGPKDDTRTLARFYLVAQHANTLDLNSAPVNDLIALMKAHGTALDTTLTAFEGSFTQRQGEVNPSYAAVIDHVPISMQRGWRENSMDVNERNAAQYRASFDKLVQMVGRLYREGIPLEAGTDDVAGFTLHRELELYVRAGIPPAEALRIATWNAAHLLGRGEELGAVAAHRSADLILVDGEPTQNISDIRHISLVMKEGVVYFPAEIYEALGVRRFADPPQVHPASP